MRAMARASRFRSRRRRPSERLRFASMRIETRAPKRPHLQSTDEDQSDQRSAISRPAAKSSADGNERSAARQHDLRARRARGAVGEEHRLLREILRKRSVAGPGAANGLGFPKRALDEI